MLQRMMQRRRTAALWTQINEILLAGEIGLETDTGKFKFGDGDHRWNDLAYQPTAVAASVLTGTLDGDRLPAMSASKRGGVPATGTPSGKVLSDAGTWATPAGGHAQQHAVDAAADHTSTATPGKMFKAAAITGLPTEATNTDAEVADAVSKRNVRAAGTTSSATPTPNADTTDLYYLTVLAEAATFGAPTGTPVNGQKLIIRLHDNGVARALTWNSAYRSRGATLLTATTPGVTNYLGFVYNDVEAVWDCEAAN